MVLSLGELPVTKMTNGVKFCENCQNRLTLGLMGLDELHLRVLATSSEDVKEKRNAQKGMENLGVRFPWLG